MSVEFRSSREIAVEVADLARAEAFYREIMGFALVDRTREYLEFDTGVLRLFVKPAAAPLAGVVPSFDVTDAAAARRRLEAAGCTIERLSPDGRGFYVRDPFGLVYDVIERPPA
jgi:catechol 2,3-dioxygenase-like lactoylglutathione lyase family enzyme